MLKKVLASVLAGAIVFGGAAVLPEGAVSVGSQIEAKAEDVLTYGDFEYRILDDGTVEISEYKGSDAEVTIPSTIDGKMVTSIGEDAFIDDNLVSITVDADNKVFSSYDGVLYNKDKTALIICPCAKQSLNVPNTVKSINDKALCYCVKLTSVKLPDGITSIGEFAFYDCLNLTAIDLPASVKSIGNGAFHGCESLTSVTIPNSVTSIGDYQFWNCNSLTSITIPNSVTNIGDNAFFNCTNLTNITIPNSVNSISLEAFYHCTSLKSITIPNSVTSIGECALGYYSDNYKTEKLEGFTIKCYSGSYAEQYAKDNKIEYELLVTPPHTHSYTSKVTTAATCTKDGVKSYTCECGDSYTETIKATGHKYTTKVVKPTYDAQGYTLHTCSCGDSYKDTYTAKLTRTSIAKAAVSGLSNKTYTGKAIKQTPVVKLSGKTLKSGTDYTVTYKNNKAVGTATVTITGKGAYTGTVSKTFKILPKKTTLKSVKSPKTKQLKVTYSKVAGVTGYQVTYSTSAKFTKATTKSVNASGTSKTISKLTKGKTYYVKVRSYKTVSKTKYYSGYSAVKKVKVK